MRSLRLCAVMLVVSSALLLADDHSVIFDEDVNVLLLSKYPDSHR